MDLRQLRVFAEVARLESFTRASEKLNIVQPAISISIRKLEESLDLTLLNRQEKRVTLTAEGETLLAHAERIFEDFSAAEAEMAELRGLGSGEVRVGITPMLSSYYFPRIIKEFHERYPNLKLSVNGEGAASIQRMISKGEIDMGVIVKHKVQEGLEFQHFLREEIVACVPANHPLAERDTMAFSDFLKEPLIFFKKGYYIREVMDELLEDSNLKAKVVFETNLFSLARSLVKERLGLSALLRMVIAGEPDLVAVSFDPPIYLDLVIAWKANRYLSRANRAFVDFLVEKTSEQMNG
ncbi:MAG: LysR family transcriptional regulator [Desulfuromonadaceae bacterium]